MRIDVDNHRNSMDQAAEMARQAERALEAARQETLDARREFEKQSTTPQDHSTVRPTERERDAGAVARGETASSELGRQSIYGTPDDRDRLLPSEKQPRIDIPPPPPHTMESNRREPQPQTPTVADAPPAVAGGQDASSVADRVLPHGPQAHRHQTDFLSMEGPNGQQIFTHRYAALDPAERKMIRDEIKARGYTHLYVYAANSGDYDGLGFDFYDRPEEFKKVLQELVNDGIEPVVWMFPDDSPDLVAKYPPAVLEKAMSRLVEAIDGVTSSYVLGLEMNEYWSPSMQGRMGSHLDSITDRPVFVHYTPGRWAGALDPWAAGVVYQYGFDRSPAEVEEETREIVSCLGGKTFIAGEYNLRRGEAHGAALGAAAMRGGAHGFGNGGHPKPADEIATRFEPPAPPPAPPRVNAAPGIPPNTQWLHTDVSKWPVTSNLDSVRITDKGIDLRHSKAGRWPVNYVGNGVRTEANAWVIVERNGKFYAGTYEWLRPGQTNKSLGARGVRNIARELGPHIKKAPLNSWVPRPGERVGFMVSTNARLGPQGPVNERSNIVWTTWPR